jgi:uncharacterized membrane protein
MFMVRDKVRMLIMLFWISAYASWRFGPILALVFFLVASLASWALIVCVERAAVERYYVPIPKAEEREEEGL